MLKSTAASTDSEFKARTFRETVAELTRRNVRLALTMTFGGCESVAFLYLYKNGHLDVRQSLLVIAIAWAISLFFTGMIGLLSQLHYADKLLHPSTKQTTKETITEQQDKIRSYTVRRNNGAVSTMYNNRPDKILNTVRIKGEWLENMHDAVESGKPNLTRDSAKISTAKWKHVQRAMETAGYIERGTNNYTDTGIEWITTP